MIFFLCCNYLIANHFSQICRGSNQSWVEDPTNNSMMYARNRIRASLRNLSTEGLQLYLKLPCLIHFWNVTRPDLDLMISGAEVNLREYPGSG
jgi:hypothetical protein